MTNRHVVVVGPVPPPVSGAAVVTSEFIAALGDHALVVNTLAGAGHRWPLRLIGVGKAALHALTAVSRRSTDTAYICLPGGRLSIAILPAIASARFLGNRIFLHHHSTAYLTSRNRTHAILQWVAGPRAIQIVLCERMRDLLIDAYKRENVRVISNASLFAPGRRRSWSQTDVLRVGHLSNLTTEKGLDLVVDTAIALRKEGRPVELHVAGPIIQPEAHGELCRAATELGEAFTYHGAIDRNDLSGFYGAIDLFLLPSRYRHEAEPLVVFEAASHGVPSLTSDIGCLAEVGFAVTTTDLTPGSLAALAAEAGRHVDWEAAATTSRRARSDFAGLIRELTHEDSGNGAG